MGIVVLSSGMVVFELLIHPHLSYSPPEYSGTLNTQEYQLNIPPTEVWLDREYQIDLWMAEFERLCTYFSLENANVTTSYRMQYYYSLRGEERCNSDFTIRLRNYYDEGDKDGCTLDLKGNSWSHKFAFEFPFEPNVEYAPISKQKCELDHHSGWFDKTYSKETQLSLTNPIEFRKCSDITAVFPGLIFDEKYETNVLRPDPPRYWFVREYTGYMNDDTKYKVTFTLQYFSKKRCISGSDIPGKRSEWSIRLYSLDDGNTNTYNERVLSNIEFTWNTLRSRSKSGFV